MDFSSVSYERRSQRGERWRIRCNLYDAVLQFVFFTFSAFWMELMYHVFTYHSIDLNLMYPFLFSLGFGAVGTALTGLFPQKINKILSTILIVGLALFYCTEQVYKSLFKVPLVLNLAVGGAGDVTQYWKEALREILKNLPAILLIFIPLLIVLVLHRKRQFFTRHSWKVTVPTAFLAIGFWLLPIGIIHLKGTDSMIYANYYELNDQSLAAKQMGILTTFCRDAQGVGRGGGDLTGVLAVTPSPTEESQSVNANPAVQGQEHMDTSPNIMSIDFDALNKTETDENLKALNDYFKNAQPTKKNPYTGKFAGKNLILLTAESYSPWAVDETLTPTLYKLTHEGFVFQNFYTSLWQTSTSDGEYVALTGLIPDGSQSMKRSKAEAMPFTMAKQFNRFGIKSRAYHSNSLSYYDRYLTHTNLGYEFFAARLGKLTESYHKYLFKMDNVDAWPNSDYDCMKATFGLYANDELFHTYYMTLSGHCQYTFSGNSMAAKNKELVKNLPYTEAGKAYIAQNIELDKALEYLIAQLKEKDILDNTVIALSADHYPYEMDKKDIDSLAGEKVEETFDLYKNQFILWNSTITTPIQITKPCSSLDILPTLSNLFGFTYDSRLLAGKDILSDSEGLVIFNNKNFITDKVKYNNATKKVTYLVDKSQVPEGYVKGKIQEVKALFAVSAGILDNDYYKYIESYLQFPNYKETLYSKKTQ